MSRWNISISSTQIIPISHTLHLDCSPISPTIIIYLLTIFTESKHITVFLEVTFISLNYYLFIKKTCRERCVRVQWSCISAETGK